MAYFGNHDGVCPVITARRSSKLQSQKHATSQRKQTIVRKHVLVQGMCITTSVYGSVCV